MNDIFLKLDKMRPQNIKEHIKENLSDCFEEIEKICECLENDQRKSVKCLKEYLIKEKKKYDDEVLRVKELYRFDRKHGTIVCGVDEVGRGPLAGPIVSCAVILKSPLKKEDMILWINDSKKLSKATRERLAEEIKERCLAYCICEHSNDDIDSLGISFCNNNIFLKSIDGLDIKPETVLSDGYPVRNYSGRNVAVIKGDTKSAAIACASILAKVYRDKLMEEYDKEFPGYGFSSNVGYGSKEHCEAIIKLGPCKIHRTSFIKNILDNSKNNEK